MAARLALASLLLLAVCCRTGYGAVTAWLRPHGSTLSNTSQSTAQSYQTTSTQVCPGNAFINRFTIGAGTALVQLPEGGVINGTQGILSFQGRCSDGTNLEFTAGNQTSSGNLNYQLENVQIANATGFTTLNGSGSVWLQSFMGYGTGDPQSPWLDQCPPGQQITGYQIVYGPAIMQIRFQCGCQNCGCQCLSSWNYTTIAGVLTTVTTGCANPGKDRPVPWCYVNQTTCQFTPFYDANGAWDNCAAENDTASLNTAKSVNYCSCLRNFNLPDPTTGKLLVTNGDCITIPLTPAWCIVNATTCQALPRRTNGLAWDVCSSGSAPVNVAVAQANTSLTRPSNPASRCKCMSTWEYSTQGRNYSFAGTCGNPGNLNVDPWCYVDESTCATVPFQDAKGSWDKCPSVNSTTTYDTEKTVSFCNCQQNYTYTGANGTAYNVTNGGCIRTTSTENAWCFVIESTCINTPAYRDGRAWDVCTHGGDPHAANMTAVQAYRQPNVPGPDGQLANLTLQVVMQVVTNISIPANNATAQIFKDVLLQTLPSIRNASSVAVTNISVGTPTTSAPAPAPASTATSGRRLGEIVVETTGSHVQLTRSPKIPSTLRHATPFGLLQWITGQVTQQLAAMSQQLQDDEPEEVDVPFPLTAAVTSEMEQRIETMAAAMQAPAPQRRSLLQAATPSATATGSFYTDVTVQFAVASNDDATQKFVDLAQSVATGALLLNLINAGIPVQSITFTAVRTGTYAMPANASAAAGGASGGGGGGGGTSLSTGAIAGIVIGAFVFVILHVAMLAVYLLWRKKKMEEQHAEAMAAAKPGSLLEEAFPSYFKEKKDPNLTGSSQASERIAVGSATLRESFDSYNKAGLQSGGSSNPQSLHSGDHRLPHMPWSDWEINPAEIEICKKPDGSDWVLGVGAFGKVYKAVWNGLQPVACKIVRGQTAEFQEEVRREIAILKGCRNGYVVQFIGACLDNATTMLVTELMEGGTLSQNIHGGWMSFNNGGREVAIDAARGLAYLHSKRIAHLDIKSANILLSRDGTAKVADVGLARVLQATFVANPDKLQGTFAYASPEVISGLKTTEKADIFSFGVLLWEICAKAIPQRGTMRDLLVPQECPQGVVDLIHDCMKFDPDERPTAKEVLRRLLAIVGDKSEDVEELADSAAGSRENTGEKPLLSGIDGLVADGILSRPDGAAREPTFTTASDLPRRGTQGIMTSDSELNDPLRTNRDGAVSANGIITTDSELNNPLITRPGANPLVTSDSASRPPALDTQNTEYSHLSGMLPASGVRPAK